MCSEKNKFVSKQEAIREIKTNYLLTEQEYVTRLTKTHGIHKPTIGKYRENAWKELFQSLIPKKFVIEQSICIIDSSFRNDGSQIGISPEVDLAIIDETYTPYIFHCDNLKLVPIEAVAVAIECKSGNDRTVEWNQRIDDLKTSASSIARIATGIAFGGTTTQKSTRPIKILCTIDKGLNKDLFDICLIANKDELSLTVLFNDSITDLYKAYYSLNHHTSFDCTFDEYKSAFYKENSKAEESIESLKGKSLKCLNIPGESLLSFNFQLNQLLMLINNPLLFPHQAYVDMFNEKES